MAKKFTFTTDEKKKALGLIKKRLAGSGWVLTRLNKLSEADQLAYAEKQLRKYARRSKAGAVDWTAFFEALSKFITALIAALGPFINK